jgi:hypothetical protein
MVILLRFGAGPDLGDADSTPPLHIAASAGFCEGIEMLLLTGANTERRDRMGETALYRAAMEGLIEAFQLLLAAGADPCVPSFVGETPVTRATYAQQSQAIELLRSRRCSLENVDQSGFTIFLDGVYGDCHSILSTFPISEVDNIACINDGRNLMHLVVSNLDVRTDEIVLDLGLRGIDAYAMDDVGFTALDYLKQRPDCVDVYKPFCAPIVSILPARCDVVMEDEFFDALEVVIDEKNGG